MKAFVLTDIPSPYQVELFNEIAAHRAAGMLSFKGIELTHGRRLAVEHVLGMLAAGETAIDSLVMNAEVAAR